MSYLMSTLSRRPHKVPISDEIPYPLRLSFFYRCNPSPTILCIDTRRGVLMMARDP